MRKILTKRKQKSKERFNQIIVGLVLVFLLMFSIIGYSLIGRNSSSQDKEKVIYKGLEFVKINEFWVLKQEGVEFIFRYNPEEVERIDSQVDYINSYINQPLYIYSESLEATSEIYTNMNELVQRMQNACIDKDDCEGDLPIKGCDSNFIIIRESSIIGITQNQSCVFIEGPKENLVRITDEFIFKTLGIE